VKIRLPQLFTAAALSLLVACDTREPLDRAAVPASAGVIDSALPIAEHLKRMRATLSYRPESLLHASPSADALVERWVLTVATRDTIALRQLHIDRAEFADLVYEQLRISKPPYEMAPELLWFQLSGNSEDGLRKVLDRFGGRQVTLRSLRCPAPADTQGVLQLRDGCLLRLRVDGDSLAEERYFGSIVSRDGRFKFLGYSNRL
jgi:hypothetical protein